MTRDLAVAIRTLAKRPGYSLAVILTLALGIAATTLTFSVADAALLRPLPFTAPDRLVSLTGVAGPQRSRRGGSMPEIADWRAMNRTLQDVSVYDETSLNLRIGTEVVRVETELVNAGFFDLLGARAAIGRTFRPDEDEVPGRDAVAVISDALWRERLGGDPGILQRTMHLNDRAFSIVGVMPAGFAGASFDTDLWVPSMMVTLSASPSIVRNRGTRWLGALGRLRDGVTFEQAQEDLSRVAAILEQQYPQYNRQRGVELNTLKQTLLGDTRDMVIALAGAVLLFLVIACANVAGLQLARAAARRRELAVRLALGARTRHVLAQLLTESLVLALAAGTLGTLVAAWALGGLIALTPQGALPRHVVPALDPRAIAFALCVSVLAAGLVAILPAMAATRRDVADAIKEGARSAGPGLGSIRRPSTHQVLVVAEIAVAMTLLSAAGLMVRSLERQMRVPVGFDAPGVTVARLTLPGDRYTPPERVAFAERLVERLRATPGVASASIATSLPFTGNSSASIMVPEDAIDADAGQRYYRNSVTPEFFSTLGIALERGRGFTEHDRTDTPAVAIINASAARRLWGTVDAVGRRFKMGTDGPTVEVIGVAADARFRSLTTDLTAPRLEPDVYFPFAQRPNGDIEIAVRTRDGSAMPPTGLQAAVAGVDQGLPLYAVQRLEDALRQQTSTARFGSALLTIFSGGALALAAVGLYGLIAYIVGLSHREIGIRLALGADARRVATLIVGNGLMLVAAGIAIGSAGAAAAGRALENQLFQTRAFDAPTVGAVALLLVGVAAVASAIPTRRAMRVDPQSALRAD
jgi:predicted permease